MAAKWPLSKPFEFYTPINFPRRQDRVYNRKRFTEQIGVNKSRSSKESQTHEKNHHLLHFARSVLTGVRHPAGAHLARKQRGCDVRYRRTRASQR